VVLAGMAADAIAESAALAAGAAGEAAAYAGELAAWDVYGTASAELFGVGVRDAFYGEYLIVNGALFWGSTVGVTGTLAAEGGGKSSRYTSVRTRLILASNRRRYLRGSHKQETKPVNYGLSPLSTIGILGIRFNDRSCASIQPCSTNGRHDTSH
jgi:hypothetical protein